MAPPQPSVFLEVIVTTLPEAIEAAAGGADRLEVVRDLAQGGLTPALELVHQISSSVAIPIRVMLRENNSMCLRSEAELHSLCQTATHLNSLAIDGLVVGFINDSQLDLPALRAIAAAAPDLKITFHRAFDLLSDPSETQTARLLAANDASNPPALPAASFTPQPACARSSEAQRARLLAANGESNPPALPAASFTPQPSCARSSEAQRARLLAANGESNPPALPAASLTPRPSCARSSEAIYLLKTIPQVDRILTTGGPGSWSARKLCLDEWQRIASPEITILAAVGLPVPPIDLLRCDSQIREIHVGRAARIPPEIGGQVSRIQIARLKGQPA